MPSPLLVAGISAASQVIGSGVNAYAQGRMNKKTRQFAREMYGRQRQDALADWLMQNQYNSPEAQMKRLKAAGLNPKLVYGSGGFENTGGTVRSSDSPSWNPRAPEVDLAPIGNSIMQYYDVQRAEAEIENLHTQNTVMETDKLLKTAQMIGTLSQASKTGMDTARAKFDLDLQSDLRETTIEAAVANLKKTLTDTQVTLDRNEREIAMNASNLKEAAERILTLRMGRSLTQEQKNEIRHRIHNLDRDGKLKELDINLKKMGIQPGDPAWMRILQQNLGENIGTKVKNFSKGFTRPGMGFFD